MRFVHAADLHLDSPLSGLRERLDGRPDEIEGATRRAFHNMIDRAVEERVDLVVIAGDIFDRDWPDYGSAIVFANGLARLDKAGIHVVLIRGNHDAANVMSRKLALPGRARELPSRAPGTVVLEDIGVAVHGQSFADRAEPRNMVAAYPAPVSGMFNIGLLHTSANGRAGHDPYAPCELSDLIDRGYDYWALGHVHTREVLCERPWVVFPGNLQGRHVNEPGSKGFSLVTVESGSVQSVEHVAVDVVRWARVSCDLSAATTIDDACPLIASALKEALAAAEGRALAARLVLTGATGAHGALAGSPDRLENECGAIAEQADGSVWIERIEVDTRAREDEPALGGFLLGDLAGLVGWIRQDPSEAGAVLDVLRKGLDKVPLSLRSEVELAGLSEAHAARVLADAEALVLHRLGVATASSVTP